MSKNTAAVDILLLKWRVTWSVNLIHWSVVLWRARKPKWLALSRPFSSICFWTSFKITFSNSLPVVNRRLIGRKFWGNFGSLPGFGKVITFASLQGFGKCDSWRQWLNNYICYSVRGCRCEYRHPTNVMLSCRKIVAGVCTFPTKVGTATIKELLQKKVFFQTLRILNWKTPETYWKGGGKTCERSGSYLGK
jgi:hypothetical protein